MGVITENGRCNSFKHFWNGR